LLEERCLVWKWELAVWKQQQQQNNNGGCCCCCIIIALPRLSLCSLSHPFPRFPNLALGFVLFFLFRFCAHVFMCMCGVCVFLGASKSRACLCCGEMVRRRRRTSRRRSLWRNGKKEKEKKKFVEFCVFNMCWLCCSRSSMLLRRCDARDYNLRIRVSVLSTTSTSVWVSCPRWVLVCLLVKKLSQLCILFHQKDRSQTPISQELQPWIPAT
jgi:hypothetical protein